jgi:hypothetical protein
MAPIFTRLWPRRSPDRRASSCARCSWSAEII